MPSGRFVNKTISISDQLASDRVSIEAALFFTWCIPHLDVDGRITGNPRVLKSLVVPTRDEISAGAIPDLIRTLAGPDVDLVRWYEVDGTKVLWFPGFRRQQPGMKPEREAKSKFPNYDVDNAKDLVTEQVRTNSGPNPDLVPLKEVKVSKDKSKKKEKTLSGQKESLVATRRRGVQLPDGWQPNARHKQIATECAVDVDVQSEKFKDWAAAKGAVYRDWDAAFRNWLRNARNFTNGNQAPASSPAKDVRHELPQSNGRRTGHPVRVDGFDPEAEKLKREREENATVDAWTAEHKQDAEAIATEIAEQMRTDIRWRGTPQGIVQGVARGLYRTRVLELINRSA